MTDESDLLRRLIEKEILWQIEDRRASNRPLDAHRIAEAVADEVMRQLERMGAQVVRMHANGPRGEDH